MALSQTGKYLINVRIRIKLHLVAQIFSKFKGHNSVKNHRSRQKKLNCSYISGKIPLYATLHIHPFKS